MGVGVASGSDLGGDGDGDGCGADGFKGDGIDYSGGFIVIIIKKT